jgi:hypothetical protein
MTRNAVQSFSEHPTRSGPYFNSPSQHGGFWMSKSWLEWSNPAEELLYGRPRG